MIHQLWGKRAKQRDYTIHGVTGTREKTSGKDEVLEVYLQVTDASLNYFLQVWRGYSPVFIVLNTLCTHNDKYISVILSKQDEEKIILSATSQDSPQQTHKLEKVGISESQVF